jgi:hypothetical protein
MKLIGIKSPRKKRKEAAVSMTNVMSLKGSKNTFSFKARGFGGSREATVNKAMIRRPKRRNAIATRPQGPKSVRILSAVCTLALTSHSPPKTNLGD